MSAYIALIRKAEDSTYGVEFPDFPGCISFGDTIDEVAHNAREALELHTEDLENLPAATELDAVVASADHADLVTAIVVPLPPRRGRSVRINITLDEALLGRIDASAARKGTNRSAFLAEAARHELEAR